MYLQIHSLDIYCIWLENSSQQISFHAVQGHIDLDCICILFPAACGQNSESSLRWYLRLPCHQLHIHSVSQSWKNRPRVVKQCLHVSCRKQPRTHSTQTDEPNNRQLSIHLLQDSHLMESIPAAGSLIADSFIANWLWDPSRAGGRCRAAQLVPPKLASAESKMWNTRTRAVICEQQKRGSIPPPGL